LLMRGDLASARLFFRRAADAGDVRVEPRGWRAALTKKRCGRSPYLALGRTRTRLPFGTPGQPSLGALLRVADNPPPSESSAYSLRRRELLDVECQT